ncbi:MAG TPA: aryl-sulfate sulfotransferase [Gammaproteobacteria bacterium]
MKRSIAWSIALTASSAHADSLRKETGLTHWDEDLAYNGYTLFGADANKTTYLLDMQGNVVHHWRGVGAHPRLLDNGNLLDTPDDDDATNTFIELDWDGNVVWRYTDEREDYVTHHDWARIVNPKLGEPTTLYLANRAVTHDECIALGCDPANGPYDGAQVDTVVEVDMHGNVLWEWRFVDHLIQDFDPSKANYVGDGKTIADYPGRLNANLPGRPIRRDWLHLNGMDYNERLDQIAFDTVQGEVYIIDHGGTFVPGDPAASIALAAGEGGDLLYRFGDPARYGQGDPPSISADWTVSTTGHKQIGGVHDIHWIDDGLPGAGNLLMINNGQYLFERTPQSYIFEVNPYLDANGNDTGRYINPPDAGYYVWQSEDFRQTHKRPKNISNQIVWIYNARSGQNFFTHIGGGAQRLPNGNTLITSESEGQLFEVTPEGELAWEYINPVMLDRGSGAVSYRELVIDAPPMSNPVFKAFRYGADHPALAGRELTPKGTIVEFELTRGESR